MTTKAPTKAMTVLHACEQTEDTTMVQLEHLEGRLDKNQMKTTVDEVIEELVDHVQTPRLEPLSADACSLAGEGRHHTAGDAVPRTPDDSVPCSVVREHRMATDRRNLLF